jgi:predicted transcriptional regulator
MAHLDAARPVGLPADGIIACGRSLIIRDRKPQPVAALAELTGRAQPNLTRPLAKLEAAGLITLQTHGRRKAPTAAVRKIVVEIDPYSDHDRLRVA